MKPAEARPNTVWKRLLAVWLILGLFNVVWLFFKTEPVRIYDFNQLALVAGSACLAITHLVQTKNAKRYWLIATFTFLAVSFVLIIGLVTQ